MPESLPDLQAIAARIIPTQPRAVFFDAVGTLFGVCGSVGQIYREVAATWGATNLETADLDRAFGLAFKAAPPPAFPAVAAAEIPAQERAWWQAVVADTFDRAGARPPDFAGFFAALFEHFATAAPWQLYPETAAALGQLQAAGIPLGIISNFDSRLPSVLVALGIEGYFSSTTISTLTGAAKPDRKIFQAALARYGVPPASAWHVGDSPTEDYDGARAAGLQAILVLRQPSS